MGETPVALRPRLLLERAAQQHPGPLVVAAGSSVVLLAGWVEWS
jgi:hypothetical protein